MLSSNPHSRLRRTYGRQGEPSIHWSVKVAFAVFMLGMLYLGFHTSPEQIAACVEHTGWSAERCQIELTR